MELELIEFNPQNCASGGRISSPCLSVNFKTGFFAFNGSACELIGLKAKDTIKIFQNPKEPGDWYVEKVSTGGFGLRRKKHCDTLLIFNNIKLAKKIADSVEFVENSGKLRVAGQATTINDRTLWGIITTTLTNRN
jgi:hypothetical protein